MMPRSEYNHHHLDVFEPPRDMEEKRAKREIANMNERRRMQNINAGFHSLRTLLPSKHDGEKLSKAAILQNTANYIYRLESEMSKLLQQISELKQAAGIGGSSSSSSNASGSEWMARLQSQPPDCPSCKRRKYDQNHRADLDSSSPINGEDMGSSTDSSSETELGKVRNRKLPKDQKGFSDAALLRKQLHDLQRELYMERRLRRTLEDELQNGRLANGIGRIHGAGDEIEVANESIEIEMHSCPASPPEMLIAGNENNDGTVYTSNHFQVTGQNNNNHHHPSLVITEQHNQGVHNSKQQNAIALPIDVPFVTHEEEVVVDSNDHQQQQIRTATSASKPPASNGPVVVVVESTTKKSSTTVGGGQAQILQLVQKNVTDGSAILKPVTTTTTNTTNGGGINAENLIAKLSASGGGGTGADKQPKPGASRNSLKTIVEAIKHLEGGFMAQQKEEESSPSSTMKTTKTIVANNNTNNNSNNGATPRPQIIQIQRPNVIVANSVDN